MTERWQFQPNREDIEQKLDTFIHLFSEEEVATAEHIVNLLADKIDFLHGKLTRQTFINSRGKPVDWNPVIGLGYRSPMWIEHSPERFVVEAFLDFAGLEKFHTGPVSQGDDDMHQGMMHETYLLENIPPLFVTNEEENTAYRFAYRLLTVKNEAELGDARKEYDFGPSGTMYQEIGVLKMISDKL